jgi:hypothetical protein
MTVPDVRRLLQRVLAVAAAAGNLLVQDIALSDWRQERNRMARESHAKARRRQLRDTG